MGEQFETTGTPELSVAVDGTGPIAQIDVIKNNTYVYKVSPREKSAHFEYVDTAITPGDSYYYVRAELWFTRFSTTICDMPYLQARKSNRPPRVLRWLRWTISVH